MSIQQWETMGQYTKVSNPTVPNEIGQLIRTRNTRET